MPADALPQPWPEPLTGTVHYRREYLDILGRAMRGKATIAPSDGAPVIVELHGGVLEVDLPPDAYTVTAELRTVDGHRAHATDTVTLD